MAILERETSMVTKNYFYLVLFVFATSLGFSSNAFARQYDGKVKIGTADWATGGGYIFELAGVNTTLCPTKRFYLVRSTAYYKENLMTVMTAIAKNMTIVVQTPDEKGSACTAGGNNIAFGVYILTGN